MKYPSSFSALRILLLSLAFLGLAVAGYASNLSITAANVSPSTSAVYREALAGAAITAGQVVYKSATDQKLYLADADSATAAVRDAVGIAVVSGAIGAKVTYVIEDPALVIGATVSNGAVYVLSATAGGIAPVADLTTGWYPTIIAVGTSSTTIAFRARGIRSGTAL